MRSKVWLNGNRDLDLLCIKLNIFIVMVIHQSKIGVIHLEVQDYDSISGICDLDLLSKVMVMGLRN